MIRAFFQEKQEVGTGTETTVRMSDLPAHLEHETALGPETFRSQGRKQQLTTYSGQAGNLPIGPVTEPLEGEHCDLIVDKRGCPIGKRSVDTT
jgi:hypothetical protein